MSKFEWDVVLLWEHLKQRACHEPKIAHEETHRGRPMRLFVRYARMACGYSAGTPRLVCPPLLAIKMVRSATIGRLEKMLVVCVGWLPIASAGVITWREWGMISMVWMVSW